MSQSDQLRQALSSKSSDEFINIIRTKGEAKKRQVFDAAKFQTSDYQEVKRLIDNLQAEEIRLSEAKAQYGLTLETKRNDAARSQTETDVAEKAHQDALGELATLKKGADESEKYKQECKGFLAEIKVNLIKAFNKLLYEESPEPLIRGIEPFVAILRNKETANNVDVELFFINPDNLITKMGRMDMASMDETVVDMKLKDLVDALPAIESAKGDSPKTNFAQYAVFVRWGISFCRGAQIDLKIKQQEDRVSQAQKDLTQARIELQRHQRVLKEISENKFDVFHQNAIDKLVQKRERIAPLIEMDRMQAEQFQETYNQFDRAYFKEYVKLAQKSTQDFSTANRSVGGRKSLLNM